MQHTDFKPLVSAAKKQIRRTLATQEPCTFEQILFELECPGIDSFIATPICILALADLIESNEIYGISMTASAWVDNPKDYAWVLSVEAIDA